MRRRLIRSSAARESEHRPTATPRRSRCPLARIPRPIDRQRIGAATRPVARRAAGDGTMKPEGGAAAGGATGVAGGGASARRRGRAARLKPPGAAIGQQGCARPGGPWASGSAAECQQRRSAARTRERQRTYMQHSRSLHESCENRRAVRASTAAPSGHLPEVTLQTRSRSHSQFTEQRTPPRLAPRQHLGTRRRQDCGRIR